MAKVRIQAGYQDDDVSEEDEKLPGPSSRPSTKKRKDIGAVALLTKVLKEQGFAGWYQVRPGLLSFSSCLLTCLAKIKHLTGNGGSDYEGRLVSGIALHV